MHPQPEDQGDPRGPNSQNVPKNEYAISSYGTPSIVSLPTLSQLGADVSNIDQYRPKMVVQMGQAGWEFIFAQLQGAGDLDLKNLIPLSEGGMGWVLEGIQTSLNRRVAIKVSKFPTSAEIGEMFHTEAKETAALKHPRIPEIYLLGKLPTGHPYFVMEFIDGRTLEELRPGLHAGSTTLGRSETRDWRAGRLGAILTYIKEAAEALHHAHQFGVFHRDIKPDNLKVDEKSGSIKVLDWGLLKNETPSALGEGAVIGTVDYMAPEQARGLSTHVDARSDVWGLGATLYALVCGKPPLEHHGDTPKRLAALRDSSALPFRIPTEVDPTIPKELESIILRALQTDREKRYDTALSFAKDLDAFRSNSVVAAHCETLSPSARFYYSTKTTVSSWLHEHRIKLGVGIFAVALTGAGVWGVAALQEAERVAARDTADKSKALDKLSDDTQKLIEDVARNSRLRKESEAFASITPELLDKLSANSSDPRIASHLSTLLEYQRDLGSLLELRKRVISIYLNDKDFNPRAKFVVDFSKISHAAAVYFPNGISDESIRTFGSTIKNSRYTPAQREELLNRMIELFGLESVRDYPNVYRNPSRAPKEEGERALLYLDKIEIIMDHLQDGFDVKALPGCFDDLKIRALVAVGRPNDAAAWAAQGNINVPRSGSRFVDGYTRYCLLNTPSPIGVTSPLTAIAIDKDDSLGATILAAHYLRYVLDNPSPLVGEDKDLAFRNRNGDYINVLIRCMRLAPENVAVAVELTSACRASVQALVLTPRDKVAGPRILDIGRTAYLHYMHICGERNKSPDPAKHVTVDLKMRMADAYMSAQRDFFKDVEAQLIYLRGSDVEPNMVAMLDLCKRARNREPIDEIKALEILRSPIMENEHKLAAMVYCAMAEMSPANRNDNLARALERVKALLKHDSDFKIELFTISRASGWLSYLESNSEEFRNLMK